MPGRGNKNNGLEMSVNLVSARRKPRVLVGYRGLKGNESSLCGQWICGQWCAVWILGVKKNHGGYAWIMQIRGRHKLWELYREQSGAPSRTKGQMRRKLLWGCDEHGEWWDPSWCQSLFVDAHIMGLPHGGNVGEDVSLNNWVSRTKNLVGGRGRRVIMTRRVQGSVHLTSAIW